MGAPVGRVRADAADEDADMKKKDDIDKLRDEIWKKYGDIIIEFMQLDEDEQNRTIQKYMTAELEKNKGITSNVRHVPNDLAVTFVIMEKELGFAAAAYRIEEDRKMVPDREPKAWGPYHSWDAYPDPLTWDDEDCERYKKDMWMRWVQEVNINRLMNKPIPQSWPKPVWKDIYTWYVYVVDIKSPASLANAIKAESWLQSNGFAMAISTAPGWVRVRDATKEEEKLRIEE